MEFFFDVLKGMFLGVIFVALCALVLGLPLMALWNWLMPMLLNILAGILFGRPNVSTSDE